MLQVHLTVCVYLLHELLRNTGPDAEAEVEKELGVSVAGYLVSCNCRYVNSPQLCVCVWGGKLKLHEKP